MRGTEDTRHAFTLVELSIVLVIVALLVGGVLVGQTMLHAYELRAVVTDIDKLTTALNTFRDKYRGMPGDIQNATSFWGAADGGDGLGSDCGNAETTDGTTCNGDGDGVIIAAAVNGVWEKLRLWQQLANAKLISGTYTGAPTAGNAFIGKHWPASRLKPGGYEINFPGYGNNVYAIPRSHFIKLAALAATDTIGLNGAILSPDDVYGIDLKIDDGISYSGRVVAIDGIDVGGCVTNGLISNPGTTGSYMTPSNTISCRIYFNSSF